MKLDVVRPEPTFTLTLTAKEAEMLCCALGRFPLYVKASATPEIGRIFEALNENLPDRVTSFSDYWEIDEYGFLRERS